MDAQRKTEQNRSTVERTSDREVVVTRIVNGPARLVFEAWANPELFQRWWVPKSFGIPLRSCEMDVRTGGTYRLVFDTPEGHAFYGKYVEVVRPSRIVWTNEEGGPDAVSVTTVTFEDLGETTRVVVHELHPSKEALDASEGASAGMVESLNQLDELLATQR